MNKRQVNSKQNYRKRKLNTKFIILMVVIILAVIGTIKLPSLFIDDDSVNKVENTESIETMVPSVSLDEEDEGYDHSLGSLVYETTWTTEGIENFSSEVDVLSFKVKSATNAKLANDDIYLKAGNYTLEFEVSSDEYVGIYIEIDNDDESVFYSSAWYEGDQTISFDFYVSSPLYAADIEIYLQTNASASNVEIKSFKITTSTDSYNVLVNQVGYQPEQRKIISIKGRNGDYFNVVDYETNEIVGTYQLTDSTLSTYTSEYIQSGDFSNFKQEGTYYIETSFGYKSYPFTISTDVYAELLSDSLAMFTTQRCGYVEDDSIFEDLAHDSCHTELATIYTTGELIDVSGGWHDAGDYGKYVETAVKSLSDLLIATLINPETTQDLAILEEMQYELDWLFKMQRDDGAVYSRVATATFAGYVLPEDDTDMQYVLQPSTPSTAGFAAVMALASEVFEEIDSDYAQKCLEAAEKAYSYASGSYYNPAVPSEFSMGDYAVKDDSDFKFYMNIALWHATDEDKYLDVALTCVDINDIKYYSEYWNPGAVYPVYLYLDKADSKTQGYEAISNSFIDYANEIVNTTSRNVFRISLTDNFTWGSNHNIIDNAMILMMAHDIFGDMNYYDVGTEHLSYVLGHNGLNFSFVTGYGSDYPLNIHYRMTYVTGGYLEGALVGGANGSMDDPLLVENFEGTDVPDQYRYIDEFESYASNEIALHYNSSLYFVLSYIEYFD
ncbi:MAG: glycoside hydrolase family 9 protein [Erysipelotrichaceae bacterium]